MLFEIKRKKRVGIYIYMILCITCIGCNSEKRDFQEAPIQNNEQITKNAEEDLSNKIRKQDSVAENSKIDIISSEPDQTSWKIPDVVLNKMGNVKGQKIADIGAGVGYFAFLLVKLREAHVIAIDIDPSSIDLMNSLAVINLNNEEKTRFQTRLAKPDDPLLEDDEVDKAILMHLIGFIDDQKAYLSNLKNAIRKGGQLMIMDFKMKKLPVGYPAKEYRIYADQLEELLYSIGFEQIVIDDTTLNYQYILTAVNPD